MIKPTTFGLQFKNKNTTKPNPITKMKKLFYTLMLAFVLTLSFTSCTEEEIAPKPELENGGGSGSIDPIKG